MLSSIRFRLSQSICSNAHLTIFSHRFMSSRHGGCIGILREVKNKWERRCALSPDDVAQLTQSGTRVLIQPSPMRIFPDAAYTRAGAILTDDLRSAHTIFGVKEFPASTLIARKNYVIFSHTIKAQAYNMPFLDACLEKKVRLFDYETIREVSQTPSPASTQSTSNNAMTTTTTMKAKKENRRLVAFGAFAGYSGMCSTLRGLGERLLSLGFSTPFVHVASAYMYASLDDARAAIRRCGECIAADGLPSALGPLTFVFTGTGNVSDGARALFDLLPHRWVSVDELRQVKDCTLQGGVSMKLVYGCVVTARDMVKLTSSSSSSATDEFDKSHYYAHPQLYTSIFESRVIPYTSLLVNCMYWAPQFPRLLTIEHMRQLETQYAEQSSSKARRLLMIADITCDIGGSIEFLKRSSNISSPFYMYNALNDTLADEIEGASGVLMLGVDNLPAEFPVEASRHFSAALAPFVRALSEFDDSVKYDSDEARALLPREIYQSCIAADGQLTPSFAYIAALRRLNDKKHTVTASSESNAKKDEYTHTLMLEGHLFDSGFINLALDTIESHDAEFRIQHWDIQANRSQRAHNTSRAVLAVSTRTDTEFDKLVRKLEQLAMRSPLAQVIVTRIERDIERYIPSTSQSLQRPSTNEIKSSGKSVLVLGSGFVVGPLVEYLSRHGHSVTVASNQLADAQRLLVGVSGQCRAVELDSATDTVALGRLVVEHSIVVSLLPASMHVSVARLCLRHKRHLITASYVSDAMRALDTDARTAGLTFLNEVGLDPGLDHMSAMRVIDTVHARGGRVTEFESVCGGLPAPECASNPFAYKFSWSPQGMLAATRNDATYRRDARIAKVDGAQLMSSAVAYRGAGSEAFKLEHYANRNSLGYSELYSLMDASTMYRGTLRYAGTCALLDALRALGLFDTRVVVDPPSDWRALLERVWGVQQSEFDAYIVSTLKSRSDDSVTRCQSAIRWLELDSSATLLVRGQLKSSKQYSILDYLCALLIERLSYGKGERDMVILAHRFKVNFPSSESSSPIESQVIRSTLIAYGGDGPARVGGSLGGGGGPSGWSAMSRTVGLPTAIATQLVLDGRITTRGVLIPTQRSIYEPMLELLEKEGITCKEEIVKE